MKVYWSPFAPPDLYADHNLLFREPDPLAAEFPPLKVSAKGANPVDDPYFRQAIHNTFVVRSIVNASLSIQTGMQGPTIVRTDSNATRQMEMFQLIPSPRRGCAWLLCYHNMALFCDQPLEVQALPAFLHRTEFQSRISFLPRTFDCGRWFKPIEAIFEIPITTTALQMRVQEPLYYLRFNCPEPVEFVRFQMVGELCDIVTGCYAFPVIRPHTTLERAYAQFENTKLQSRVGSLIRNNTDAARATKAS